MAECAGDGLSGVEGAGEAFGVLGGLGEDRLGGGGELCGGAVVSSSRRPAVPWSVSQPAIWVKSCGSRWAAADSSPVMVQAVAGWVKPPCMVA